MYTTHRVTFSESLLGLVLGCRDEDGAAIVVSVKERSAALGICEGDVVTKINGKRVGDYDHVLALVEKIGRPVTLDVERELEPPPPPPPAPASAVVAPKQSPKPPPPPPKKKKSPPKPKTPPEEERPTTRPTTTTTPSAPSTTKPADASTDASRTTLESKSKKIAARWEELRREHLQHQESRLDAVRQGTRGDLEKRTEGLGKQHVKDKVQLFDQLFSVALHAAVAESRAMRERDGAKAAYERERRRDERREQALRDRDESRAPRPNVENVAAHPDELRLAVSEAPKGMKLVYALVDVSKLIFSAKNSKKSSSSSSRLLVEAPREEAKEDAYDDDDEEFKTMVQPADRPMSLRRDVATPSTTPASTAAAAAPLATTSSLELLAEETHRWHSYEGPLHLEEPGTYALLTKAVPVAPESAEKFEAAAGLLEESDGAPKGYADLSSTFVDAVRLGLIERAKAYEILADAMRTWERDAGKGDALVAKELKEWGDLVRKNQKDPLRERASRVRRQNRAAFIADLRMSQLDFDTTEDFSSPKGVSIVATASAGLLARRSDELTPSFVGPMLDFEAFADACAADEIEPDYAATPKEESQISSAVYELSKSPPIMWHEDFDDELAFVDDDDDYDDDGAAAAAGYDDDDDAAATPHEHRTSTREEEEEESSSSLGGGGGKKKGPRRRVCAKCGRRGGQLYAKGDLAICRACALDGAGVLVDPGARRMWFSQMIEFHPGRDIPLPRSHPLLKQILRVLQTNPGIAVRFEGHVNSTCGLDCDGTRHCASKMCRRIPGGALGLSTARAESVKDFILKCGIEHDRVYAQGFAGTRRLSDDLSEKGGSCNRRVEVHTLLC